LDTLSLLNEALKGRREFGCVRSGFLVFFAIVGLFLKLKVVVALDGFDVLVGPVGNVLGDALRKGGTVERRGVRVQQTEEVFAFSLAALWLEYGHGVFLL